jgi:hypothetical protein
MSKLTTAAGMLLCCVRVTSAFGQTTNATIGGTVADATGAFIPGVSLPTPGFHKVEPKLPK